jgi:hypothetical protein
VALYVLAFTDTDLGTWKSGRRTIRTVKLGAIYAVCERRDAVPDMSDDVLRAQHDAVVEIARRSRATLPARFGALIAERELAQWARGREAELRDALNDVRHRVQMTIRILGDAVPAARTVPTTTSGRAYLEARRQLLAPALPASARDVLRTLRPLIVRERIEAGRGGLLATVYHLISRRDLAAYRRVMKGAPAGMVLSGPWPPFAFTPPLW